MTQYAFGVNYVFGVYFIGDDGEIIDFAHEPVYITDDVSASKTEMIDIMCAKIKEKLTKQELEVIKSIRISLFKEEQSKEASTATLPSETLQ